MICINCNKEILITAKFCPECGVKIDIGDVTAEEDEGINVLLSEKDKLIHALIEKLNIVKDVKINALTNKDSVIVNETPDVPIKRKMTYFLLMLPSLIILPGLHRIYMMSYLSGVLMLSLPFLTVITLKLKYCHEYGILFHFYFVVVYLTQLFDLFRFNYFNEGLKERFDPIYIKAAIHKRDLKIAVDAENKKAKDIAKAAQAIIDAEKKRIIEDQNDLKTKSDIAELKRLLIKASPNSGSVEKVARSTCTKCHLIKPRTEMKLVTKKRRSGSSIGYGFKSKNISVRAYTSNTQVWVCDKCRSWWS